MLTYDLDALTSTDWDCLERHFNSALRHHPYLDSVSLFHLSHRSLVTDPETAKQVNGRPAKTNTLTEHYLIFGSLDAPSEPSVE